MQKIALILSLAGLVLISPFVGNAQPANGLGDLSGTVVWVDFWASWCAPCRRSFPWMNAMHRKYESAGLQIIGVNVDKDRELAEEFLGETPANFELRFDPDGQLAEAFDVQAMPSSFLLDSAGNVIARHYGFRLKDTAEYEQSIQIALEQANQTKTNSE